MDRRTDLHIVIAEDDDDDREVISDCFKRHNGFSRVDVVANGRDLLDFLRNGDALPDIVLTDINMPIMDGIRALEEIFEDDRLKRIPTFVYSTSINPLHQDKCERLGIKAYLIKPFDLDGFERIPVEILESI